ncbi:hypothetical protein CHARACLAT_033404 [Characodon lateralis]|uniref:Uncharacterized protein n=1 Tax=Characodon lateralis TaxID=208331 RepID=A0ABU7DES6_9TELE|nr:hypothetical protein [Characodon lateralis]
MRHTGVNPKGDGTGMGELFREAILKGVPFEVCQKMKNNPDLQGTDFTKWEKHLIHHLHTAQEAEKKKKEEKEQLQNHLLKLQLQEAKEKLSKRKSDKTENIMLAAAQPVPPAASAPLAAHTPMSMPPPVTDQ